MIASRHRAASAGKIGISGLGLAFGDDPILPALAARWREAIIQERDHGGNRDAVSVPARQPGRLSGDDPLFDHVEDVPCAAKKHVPELFGPNHAPAWKPFSGE